MVNYSNFLWFSFYGMQTTYNKIKGTKPSNISLFHRLSLSLSLSSLSLSFIHSYSICFLYVSRQTFASGCTKIRTHRKRGMISSSFCARKKYYFRDLLSFELAGNRATRNSVIYYKSRWFNFSIILVLDMYWVKPRCFCRCKW